MTSSLRLRRQYEFALISKKPSWPTGPLSARWAPAPQSGSIQGQIQVRGRVAAGRHEHRGGVLPEGAKMRSSCLGTMPDQAMYWATLGERTGMSGFLAGNEPDADALGLSCWRISTPWSLVPGEGMALSGWSVSGASGVRAAPHRGWPAGAVSQSPCAGLQAAWPRVAERGIWRVAAGRRCAGGFWAPGDPRARAASVRRVPQAFPILRWTQPGRAAQAALAQPPRGGLHGIPLCRAGQ